MDLLRELFDFVGDTLLLIKATEWHCGHLPPDRTGPCAVLLERGGLPSQPVLRGNVGEYRFQVLTVSGVDGSYFQTRHLAHQIHGLLNDRAGANLGEWHASVISGDSEPYLLSGDLRYRWELSTNYTVRAIPTAVWWAV